MEVEIHADRDRQHTKAGEPRDSNPRVLKRKSFEMSQLQARQGRVRTWRLQPGSRGSLEPGDSV